MFAEASRQLSFPRDHHLRKRLFVKESFHHQARANLNLLRWLISEYTDVGDSILDPMAGTGSLLVAADMGRSVILNELEPHWIDIALSNAEKTSSSQSLFSPAAVHLIEGDASKLDLISGSVDHVLFSPPYWDMFSDWHAESAGLQREQGQFGTAYADDRGVSSLDPSKNVGNVHIYEHYLRRMFAIYAECFRVMRPGGSCIVIVKDRVHKGKIVPISNDTSTLLQAIGFSPDVRHNIAWPLSRYQRLNRLRHPDNPAVDGETVLVFQKPLCPPRQAVQRVALVWKPMPGYSPGSAPVKLWEKSILHAMQQKAAIIEIDAATAPEGGFADRRSACHDAVAWLVSKHDLGAGAEILLYLPARFGQYMRERLETLGCAVEEPTAGLNMGQKLAMLSTAT